MKKTEVVEGVRLQSHTRPAAAASGAWLLHCLRRRVTMSGRRRNASGGGAASSRSAAAGGGEGGGASQSGRPAGGNRRNGTIARDGAVQADTEVVSAMPHLPLIFPESASLRTYRSAIVNLALMKGSINVEEMLRDFLAPEAQSPTSPPHDRASGTYSNHWNLNRPKIIFHITGTANPLQLSGDDPLKDFMQSVPGWFFLRMKEFITSVLFDIAVGQDGAAWMFDGGTKCGIMKLVGNLHKEVFSRMFVYPQQITEEQEDISQNKKWHSAFPLIGVSELSKIDGSSLSEYIKAVEHQCAQKNDQFYNQRFTPDDDHTHHLFMHMRALKCVREKAHDSPVISRFFSDLSEHLKCPVVCCF
jgi:hypothetical protein